MKQVFNVEVKIMERVSEFDELRRDLYCCRAMTMVQEFDTFDEAERFVKLLDMYTPPDSFFTPSTA